MPIARMDHFTILTTNAEKTVAFYNDILGFTSGPRPAFSFPGAWLYNDGKAVLHVVQRPSIPDGGGVLDTGDEQAWVGLPLLAAGMPLWAALALWNEMQGSPVPHDHWWGRLRSLTPTLQ